MFRAQLGGEDGDASWVSEGLRWNKRLRSVLPGLEEKWGRLRVENCEHEVRKQLKKYVHNVHENDLMGLHQKTLGVPDRQAGVVGPDVV